MKRNSVVFDTSRLFCAFQENRMVLIGYLRRFTASPQDIEDICQETILRALEAEKSRDIQEPRAFLFGVARNIVRKKLDKESRTIIDFIEDFLSQEYISNEPAIEDQLDSRQRMLSFVDAVLLLPKQCRRVFVLKKVYGYSHKEIARKLGISISTVEKHVATGLKRCSDYMQQEQPRKKSAMLYRQLDS